MNWKISSKKFWKKQKGGKVTEHGNTDPDFMSISVDVKRQATPDILSRKVWSGLNDSAERENTCKIKQSGSLTLWNDL